MPPTVLRFARTCRAILVPLVLLLATVAAGRGEGPPAVELRLRGNGGANWEEETDVVALTAPTVTVEVRFGEAMVNPDVNGSAGAAESPLVFTPALAGGFRWTSVRSGVWTPAEPPALSTTYRVALRPGLRRADGQELGEGISRTFHTPPLEVRTYCPGSSRGQNAPSDPEVQLLANAALEPARVTAFLRFQNAAGEQVPAVVRPAPPGRWFPSRGGEDFPVRQTWRDRFAPPAPGFRLSLDGRREPVPATAPATAVHHHLLVTPAHPLPPAAGWKLVIAEGLPSVEPGVRLLGIVETPVGDVTGLTVTGVRAINDGDGARELRVGFSRGLAPEVTPETLGRWLRVDPAPRDLRVTPRVNAYGGNPVEIEITGRFATNTDYRVTIEPGLPARGESPAFALRERWSDTARFTPLPPRLRFPDFAVHQLVGGRREFELRAVNVPVVRLRAKRFAPEAAGLALATYQREYLADNGRADFDRVDLDRIPGQTIYGATLPAVPAADGGGDDDARTLTLRWDDILGPDRRAGIVLLEAEQPTATTDGNTSRRAGTQALVQLTDLGLVWKRARGGELLVYAFSLANAQPADGATVRLLNADGQPLTETRTDADGVARLSTAGITPAFLLAARGEDCHVVPFDGSRRDEIALYRFRLPLDRWDNDEDEPAAAANAAPADFPRETLLLSDRAVYQPGETLHLKAIVRDWPAGGEPSAPAPGTAVTLRAFDARGRKFWEKAATLGAAGSLSEDIVLPTSGLGRYRLKVLYPDGRTAEPTGEDADSDEADEDDGGPETPGILRFQVQQYRPNPFEVTLTAPEAVAAAPGPVAVPLSARYYMGTPLSKALVKWEMEARDVPFRPAGFSRYTFNTGDLDSRLERGNHDAVDGHGEIPLGADGKAALAPEITVNAVAPGPRAVDLTATVTDLDQASVTARARFTVHASEFYVGLRQLPDVVREGEPLPVEVVAVRAADGVPLAEPVPVRARLSRVTWHTSRPVNASGGFDYRSEPEVSLVGERELCTGRVHRVGPEWLPETGAGAPAPFTVGEAGEYLLELVTRDAAGRAVITARSFDVLGQTEATWNLRDVRRIDLVPDRVEYSAGQTATILLKTPIAGLALVTVEREGVRRAFTVAVPKETPAVTVPLEAGDAPNVFVSVLLLRGASDSPRRVPEPEFRVGYCQLTVSRPESRLAVTVAAARGDYQPAETVAAEVRVVNFRGEPAAGAEVTLYAVDEGILSLTGYRTPDPVAAFFRRRPLGVRTGLTLPSLLPEDPDARDFGNKGYLVGGGGGVELRGDRLRENFAACALWNASLVTDAEGRAHAEFPAPDSLSRYRLMAVVHDGGNRFGSGEGAFRIRKPLMLEPALPRFGNVGDQLLLRAVVFNGSPTAGEVEVSLGLDDKAALAGSDADVRPTRRLTLAAGETRAVDYPVRFLRTGRAVWTWRARLAGDDGISVFQDTVRTTLNVGHSVPRRTEVFTFTVPAGGRLDDLLGRADPALLGGEDAMLQVSLTNSRLGELREGIGALLHYPYGCVEQTTSSLLPWIGLRGADLWPELARPPGSVGEAVARGVNRLLSMQTENGGLAYWPGGREPHPWGSAYGGLGLALAKRAGFPVPAEPFKRLCDALSRNLRADAAPVGDHYHEHAETDRCLALLALALAGRAEPAYHERMFARRDTLGMEDRALLALAIAESHGPAGMLDALLQPPPAGPGRAYSATAYSDFSGAASVLGMRLLAWCRYRPGDPAVGTLLEALLRERDGGGTWGTTQGNAWGLLAVAGYVEAVERNAAGPARGEVLLAGKRAPVTLAGGGGTAGWSGEFALPGSGPARARPPALSVVNPETHPLYLQVKLSSRPTAVGDTDAGFRVARRYERLTDDNQLEAEAGNGWQVGDRVLVSLDVETRDSATYVVVDDPLPANLEAVNPEFKTSAPAAALAASGGLDGWVSSFRELREDRAVFFCDRLRAGRYHLQYLARVRAAGTATAPATKVEAMYHPERFGLGAAGETLTTRPRE